MTEEVAQIGQATKAASGVAAGAAVGMSLMSFSSPMAVWVLANQFQLFSLLLLTNTNMPTDVKEYIKGNSFFSFSMDFLPFVKPPSDGLENTLDKEQNYNELKDIGLRSRSAIVNNVGLFATLGLFALFHLIIYFMQNKSEEIVKSTKKAKFNKIMKKVFEAFTFAVYIRFLLEGFQILLMTTFFEITRFDLSGINWMFSLLFSFALFLFTVAFYYMSVRQALKAENSNEEKSKFEEFNAGLKKKKLVRIYTPLLLLRRYFLIIWIISLLRHNPIIIITGMMLFQC